MLKKKIIALFILGISLVGITNGEYIQNCYTDIVNHSYDCIKFTIGEGENISGQFNTIENNFNFSYLIDNNTYAKTFYIDGTMQNGRYHIRNNIFWNGTGLYVVRDSNYFNKVILGKYNKVCIYSGTDLQGIGEKCGTTYQGANGCNGLISNNWQTTYNQFYNQIQNDGTIQNGLYLPIDWHGGVVCGIYQNNTYCINMSLFGFENNDIGCDNTIETIEIGQTTVGNGVTYYENMYQDSPFQSSGGGGTEEETGGATLYCPPIKHEITMYGNKFNTGLCYSNTEEISGGQLTTVTPISIFEAFPTYQNYVQAYNIITNNCHTDTVNTVEQCQEALQAIGKKPAQILLKLINSNIPEGTSIAKVYQYCHLQLDYTEEEKRNTSTCDLKENGTFYATGVTQNNSSNPNTLEGLTEALQESDQTTVIPEDGTIFDDILPDGIISRKDAIFNINLRTTRTSLTIKIMGLFKSRPIVEGLLPPIITSLLLLIVLFKIFKK